MEIGDVRALTSVEGDEDEYWTHVSAQDELPLAESLKEGPVLALVDALVDGLDDFSDLGTVRGKVAEAMLADARLLDQARLLVSVKDKRAYLDLSYLFSRTLDPEDPGTTLCGCKPHQLKSHQLSVLQNIVRQTRKPARARRAAEVIAGYLIDEKDLGQMLEVYKGLDGAQRGAVIEHLVAPGELQQREAKLRGHGGEGELAKLVAALGCAMRPEDKASDPMSSHDPNVDLDTFLVRDGDSTNFASLDLVIVDNVGVVRVCVQSLIQSSDPGQFGVEKAKETARIRHAADKFNAEAPEDQHVQLWGLLDGVGWAENKRGTIRPMLGDAHAFVQVKSLWKAALRLHQISLCAVQAVYLDPSFYSPEAFEVMKRKYIPADVEGRLSDAPPEGAIRAGKGWVMRAG